MKVNNNKGFVHFGRFMKVYEGLEGLRRFKKV